MLDIMNLSVRLLILMSLLYASAHGQSTTKSMDKALTKHGTCAITATAPFGEAFIIDSRVTGLNERGEIVSQVAGCKVALPRPTILLAGVGLEDTTGRAGHWNSLDVAKELLKQLPNDPTKADLNRWSESWGQTLIHHYRMGGETPEKPAEVVADVLLLTKVKGLPYYGRTTVSWDGAKFTIYYGGENIDQRIPQVDYAGACRYFAQVNDDDGHLLSVRVPRTSSEQQRFAYWGRRKKAAKTVTDLADAVNGFMSVSVDMDTRLEGRLAVIGAPFASAEWPEEAAGWQTSFNPECDNRDHSSKTPLRPPD